MKNSTLITKFKNIILLIFVIVFGYTLDAQTGLWNGSDNDDWQTSTNWADNIVPDNTVNVTIQSGKLFYPLINNTGDQCKSLLVEDGAQLTMCVGSDLIINGDLKIGTGTSGILDGISGSLIITGQLILDDNASATLTNCTITCASTNLSPSSTITFNGNNMNIYNWGYGNVIFAGTGNMQITGDAATPTTCNNMTINNTGNILKIPENKALTVNGTLTNNVGTTGIIVESTSLGDGSLIINTPDCEGTIDRYITGDRWHYLSSPVTQAPLILFNTNNFLWWDASVQWLGGGDFSPWKSFNSEYLNIGEGYAYYYYEDTIKFSGKINVSNYSITLNKNASGTSDYQGWNLVGNPYTSVLNWDVAVADGAVPAEAENAIYFFDDDNQNGAQSNYRYYVPASGTGGYGVGTADATGLIPMGQAFFIKTNTDNVLLNLKKDYRVHAVQEFYKSNNSDLIRFEISNGITDESILRLIDNSTFSFDAEFDAHKMFTDDENIPQIYTIDVDNVFTAINSIPEILKETKIDLGIKAIQGDLSITIKELSFYDYDVYIVDNFYNTTFNLTQNETFEFYHYGGQIENRFYLTFQDLSSDIELNKSTLINTYPNPTSDYIKLSNTGNSKFETITIQDINGKLCFMNNNAEFINKIDLADYSAGVYFIKIQLDNNTIYHNRFIVNK